VAVHDGREYAALPRGPGRILREFDA